ncbi:MAG TPA: APC family permease [Rhodanobacteraceae bacterium]|nr:APC family permease [Rhodanobacteraceae bacterium]
MDLLRLLLGHRLANRDAAKRRIGALEGVPAMGLDALGSLAYGPEAALAILSPVGIAALVPAAWIMLPIILLLVLLYASYWQTIRAYPGNSGAYAVARRNLGAHAGVLAATALMIDYVLNVAVGISAGVGALISAAPWLHPYTLPLCLGILAVITAVNLRGTQESGRAWALPTYLYIVCFAVLMTIGLFRAATSGGHPHPVVAPAPLAGSQPLTLWLLLRAFASGCTAMTGVEAVSNSMGAFREPMVRRAHATLSIIVGVLALLLAGLSWLIPAYRIGAMDQSQPGYRSVLAQLAGAVVGHGAFYFISMAALLCVLTLSANTSFIAFPRLCRNVAEDGYLPETFAQAGRRLVYSIGLLFLATSAGLLLAVFGGVTDRLIPLFAIGAFLSFTMSQAAMTVHWRRALRKRGGGRHGARHLRLAVNAVGALVTAITLIVIIVAKFTEGAWITVLAVPCVVLMLLRIHGYYQHVDRHTGGLTPVGSFAITPPAVLVVVEEWDRPTIKALDLGLGISTEVTALHLVRLSGPGHDEHLDELRRRWHEYVEEPARAAGLPMPGLRIMEAPYRQLDEPVLEVVRELEIRYPERRIAVLVPELVKQRWYQVLLHTHRARRLRKRLLGCGDTRITVVSVPWYLEPAGPPRVEQPRE